jgi:hypothetical protein
LRSLRKRYCGAGIQAAVSHFPKRKGDIVFSWSLLLFLPPIKYRRFLKQEVVKEKRGGYVRRVCKWPGLRIISFSFPHIVIQGIARKDATKFKNMLLVVCLNANVDEKQKAGSMFFLPVPGFLCARASWDGGQRD